MRYYYEIKSSTNSVTVSNSALPNLGNLTQTPSHDPVTCRVIIKRALTPGQGFLERVEEVPEHPGQDGVVEQAHQERHRHAGYACAT